MNDDERSADRDERGRVGLGLRLRELRLDSGLSLQQAAAAAGISLSYLSDVERGRRLPALDTLDRLCAVHGVLVVDVLTDLYPWGSAESVGRPVPPPDGRSARTARR